MKSTPLAAALALVVSAPCSIAVAHAQDAVGDTVVVTASRQQQRASEVMARVEVIDRAAIERAGQSSLLDLLRAQPGLRISSNGGTGSNTAAFMRGAESRHTLVLIDGMRIGSATSGQPTLEAIPLAMIERIEILRGPASALYGSEAIGGVIQIFTRKGEAGFHPELFAGLGSHGTRNLNAALTGGEGRMRYSLSVGEDKTDGINAKRDPAYWNTPWGNSYDPDSDGWRNRHFSASASLGFRDKDEVGVHVFHTDGRNEYDTNDYYDSYLDKRVGSVGAYMSNSLAEGWTSTLRVGRTEDTLRNWPDADFPSAFDSTQTQFAWQHDVALSLGTLMAAYEYVRTEVEGTTDYTVKRRSVNALLLGWSARIDAHNVQVNVRRDDNDQFGGKTTGLFSYGYRLSPQWSVQGSIGTAFNAPTFNQLYWPDTGFGGGNPDLDPERALSREIGVRWAGAESGVELTYYDNRVRDLIAGWPPVNVNRAHLRGLELVARTALAGFNLEAGLDLLDAEDEATGKDLPRRPGRAAFFRADRESGAWNYGVQLNAQGSRYEDVGNAVRLPGYGLLDAYAHYRFSPDWRLEMRANNILDKDYEVARGYGTEGASVFVGVRYTPR